MNKNERAEQAIRAVLSSAIIQRVAEGPVLVEYNIAGKPIVEFYYKGERFKLVINSMDEKS